MPLSTDVATRGKHCGVTRTKPQPYVLLIPGSQAHVQTLALALPEFRVDAVDQMGIAATVRPLAAAIADEACSDEIQRHETYDRLAAKFQDVPLAFYVRLSDLTARETLRATWWQRAGVLMEGVDDTVGRAHAAITAIHATHVVRLADALLPTSIPAKLRDAIKRAIAFARRDIDAEDVARFLDTPRRTLFDVCVTCGVDSVEDLVLWGRVFVTAYELERGFRTPTNLPRDLGYSSPRFLRKAVRARLGCSLRDLQSPGALERAVGAFVRRLSLTG